jgi:acyl-CoA thioesterase-1
MKPFIAHQLTASFCLFGLAALGLLAAAARAEEPCVVVVFGDSITAGGALPAAERSQAWVRLVEKQAAGKLRLVNEGKGGRPTDSVKDFDAMLLRNPHADVLVIALSTNDSRDITDACVPKAVKNIRAMVEGGRKAYGPKLRVLLVGPPNIRKDALGPTKPIADQRDAKLRELGAAFAKLAVETQCEFVSLYGAVPAASLTRDGVHPDAAGNAAIAKVLLAVLQKP